MIRKIAEYMRDIQWNGYDLALMTDAGIQSVSLQPCNNSNNSYSIAKAFTMTAVGLLWDERLIGMEDRIVDLLADEAPASVDARWRQATVDHALRHRLGFGEGFLDIDVDDVRQYAGRDYLQMVFQHPLAYRPGERFVYTDAAYYLLSRVVSRISQRRMDDFLMERLFNPLDFAEMAWSRCPHGFPMGGTGLYLRADDMVKLPWLYMNKGMYGGRRILSEQWVALALDRGYELAPLYQTELIGKGGLYGQMALFSPRERFAVAWHGYNKERGDAPLVRYIADLKQ